VNPLLRESAAHVFVESLGAPELSPDDAHHIERVLRVRPTDRITVSDGAGRWASGRVADGVVALEANVIAVVGRTGSDRRAVVCATPKGDRPELIVQKLTELGIDDIVFTTTTRSVVRWESRRAEKQLARLRRIAREAAMQSRRVWLPTVTLCEWSDVVSMADVALAEPSGADVDATVRAIVVGPEGGFTDDESSACSRRVALGDQVLRVETAAIAAAVLLMNCARRADGS